MSSISGVQLARMSSLLSSDTMTQQVNNVQLQLAQVQNQISTGIRVNVPSDDPGAASAIMGLQRTLSAQGTYTTNLQQSQSQLGEVDSTLSDLNNLLTQAQTIASQDVNTGVTASSRAADAQVIQTIYSQALSIGNKQFNGAYLFGGDKSTTAPFVQSADGVQFVGSTNLLQNQVDPSTKITFQASGAQIFNSLSSGANGTANLAPNLTGTTLITDLKGATGTGVSLGTIQIGNGSTSKLVDLSHANSVSDVVNAINGAGVGNITAQISGDHLVLSTSGNDNITVNEVGGGATAQDLGILKTTGSGAGASVTGAGLQPQVTPLTSIASLNNGAGIDATHGIIITNGSITKTVTFGSATTVQNLLNDINNSGANVLAQINSAGTGINILNTVQGTNLTIGENGGTTAADLGVRTFSPSTPVSELNGGQGVGLAASGADFQITNSAGASFSVTLSGAQTVQDVINKINAAATGTNVTASFSTTGNGIVLTDTSGGSGNLTVTAQNSSTAAADLGLSSPALNNVVTGSDVNPVASGGLFSDLNNLASALAANDPAKITAAATALQADQSRVQLVRGSVGAQEQQVQDMQSSLQDEQTSVQSLMAQLQDTNMPSAITQYTTLQTALQASLQTSAYALSLSLLNFL
jgi:flagellar hook-associated protein 3 FlgL